MRTGLLSTLAYFDMFHYPLTADELFIFSGQVVEKAELKTALSEMVREQLIFQTGSFYSLRPGTQLADRRVKGNEAALPQLRLAAKVAKLLSRFPYVRGIAISGSLSKNFADESTDIDLFIITASNRMWIARTLLCLFRKAFIPKSKTHWFCMNYFVDEAGMEIVEKNIFTAIETATLVPMRGARVFEDFFKANAWTRSYLPNYEVNNRFLRDGVEDKWKHRLEKIFNWRPFNWLENRLMCITDRRYKDKTKNGQLNKRGTLICMETSEHFSKPSPQNFQYKLLEKYERKLGNVLRQPV